MTSQNASAKIVTQDKVKQVLDYNPATGEFTWKVATSNRVKPGEVAGRLCKTLGYILIGIKSKTHLAHRLAWLYTYGEWPKQQVDHVDGNRSNNAIANLRDVSNRQNSSNRKCHRDGRLVGAVYYKANDKWGSKIVKDDKQHYLGLFDTEWEAHQMYRLTLEISCEK